MKDFLWDIFEKSGSIDAFLAYREYSATGLKSSVKDGYKTEQWTNLNSEQLY